MEKSSAQTQSWWDWPAIALLFILLQTASSRLAATNWTQHLYLIQLFTSIGFTIGLALGYSVFHRRAARWISFLYMFIMLPLQWTRVIDQRVSLEEQLASVGGRLVFSVTQFFSRRPVEDPLFFIAIMSVVFWIIGASAGFHLVRRQNFLAVVLPSGIAMLVVQNYDNGAGGRLIFIAFFVFIALFLLGRLNFLQDQKHWREKRIFLSPENSIDLTSGMALAAMLIILTAWTVPTSIPTIDSARQVWSRISKPWNEFAKRMENAVSALESTSGGRSVDFYGTELALGRGFPLSEEVVFTVEAPDVPFDQQPPRYYWRGRTYDHFAHGQWYTTGTTRQEFSPVNAGPSIVDTAEREAARFIFRTGESKFSLLYAPLQPVWFSRPGSFLASPAGEQKNIISWNATPLLLPGETYQADVVLSDPNIQQLREAGTQYPQWVTDNYLQLPQDFSPRVGQLAQEITANAETPYDKARAITLYLRDERNITYAETVPQPPRNADLVEWFLFQNKKGYCVYYATSEVLMLRSLGIPARMAVGFAQGDSVKEEIGSGPVEDIARTTYIVRRKHAHAWPEVYFPGIGWVEFEPTGNQAPLDRPLPPQDSANPNNANPRNDPRLEEDQQFASRDQSLLDEGLDPALQANAPVISPLYLALFFIALASLTVFLSRRYALPARVPALVRATIERSGIEAPKWVLRWEYWVTLSPIEKAFESVNFGLRLLEDEPTPIHATPAERADKLARILPHAGDQIKVLLDEHQTSLYTSRVADAAQARRAALNVQMQAIIAKVRHFWTGSFSPR